MIWCFLFILTLSTCHCSCKVISAFLESPDPKIQKLAKKELQPLVDNGLLKKPSELPPKNQEAQWTSVKRPNDCHGEGNYISTGWFWHTISVANTRLNYAVVLFAKSEWEGTIKFYRESCCCCNFDNQKKHCEFIDIWSNDILFFSYFKLQQFCNCHHIQDVTCLLYHVCAIGFMVFGCLVWFLKLRCPILFN